MIAERRVRDAVPLVGLVLLACWRIGPLTIPASAADPLADAVPVSLTEGRWSLQTPLGDAGGPLLLLLGPGADWRLEVGLDPPHGPADTGHLLRRQGEGWTLAGDAEGGFTQPWNEGWRAFGPRAAARLHDLLLAWLEGPRTKSAPDEIRRWRLPMRPATPRLPAPAPEIWLAPQQGEAIGTPAPGARHDLRRRLTGRGLGRGGPELALRAEWRGASFLVNTARWPGRLTLERIATRPLSAPAEAFLPLWPLAELLPGLELPARDLD